MARRTKLERETATAFHEAGHAVVGLMEGAPTRLLVVSIAPNPETGTLGHVQRGRYRRVADVELGEDRKPRRFHRDFEPEYENRWLLERRLGPEIVACYAGLAAEKQHVGRRTNWAGARRDLDIAARRIEWVTDNQRQQKAYSSYLMIVAEDAVRFHWKAIERLAGELLARKKMTGPAVKAFLQQASPDEDQRVRDLLATASAALHGSAAERD